MHECFGEPRRCASGTIPRTRNGWILSAPCAGSLTARRHIIGSGSGRCADHLLLGLVNYHDGHIRSKRVAIGYIINPARCRQGLATEAVSAMLNFCFDRMSIHRVQAFIHPENVASLRLVEKLGFRREGLLRDNLRVGDVWRDEVVYALLESDRHVQV